MDLTKMVDPDLEQDLKKALDEMTRDKETFLSVDRCLRVGHASMSSIGLSPCALAILIMGNALERIAQEKGLIE